LHKVNEPQGINSIVSGKKMKTRITLVNPPYPIGSHQHPPFMPLGIGYLGAVLYKNHFEVNVIDCQEQKLTHKPNCITAIGCPHVTFWDDKALEEKPSLDVVARREGENTMLQLAQRVEKDQAFHDLTGTTCRKGTEIRERAFQSFYLSPAYFVSALGMFRKGKMWGVRRHTANTGTLPKSNQSKSKQPHKIDK
jgi:radical SAM superfamily enzyme YgiQ (UPF0313 family)